jgi:hypothetical protein
MRNILPFCKRNATQLFFTCSVGSRWKTCFTLRPYVTPVSKPCYSTVCPQVSTPHEWLPMDKICPARASSARSSLQRPTSLTITTHCWSCSGDSSSIMISHTHPSVEVSSIGPPWVKTLSLGMNWQKFRCVWPGQNALDQSAVVFCYLLLCHIWLHLCISFTLGMLHTELLRNGDHWQVIAAVIETFLTEPRCFSARPGMILDLTHAVKFKYTDMCHLTTGIHSEKCVVRWFCHCANMYLNKPR